MRRASFQLMKAQAAGSRRRSCRRIRPSQTVTGSVGGGGFGPSAAAAPARMSPSLSSRWRSANLQPIGVIARLRPKLDQVAGVHDFPAGGAGLRRRRRPIRQLSVSVHVAGRRSDRIAHLVAETSHRAAGCAGNHRCGHRFAARRPGSRPDRGSRQRLAARAHGNTDRQYAGRCICPGAGVDHLQPVQPAAISCGHGGGAGILAEPGNLK